MSTFGALNTAYRGLTAAQQGMNVAGQNIANAATEGYTRQRVEQSSIGAPSRGLFSGGLLQAGQGVSVDSIARLGNGFLDAGVRSTGAQAGFASARSAALQGIEGVLQEPGDNGISSALHDFWSAWQGASNNPGDATAKGLVLQAGTDLAAKVSTSYRAFEGQWSSVREQAQRSVDTVNAAASQVAAYNTTIRSTLAAGGSANELIDARAKLTDTISRLSGGTIRGQADGTVDVLVGGNALVTGGSVRALALSGSQGGDKMGSTVQLQWTDRAGAAITDISGAIAGALSVLAPAAKGGAIASAAESLNQFASKLGDTVNAAYTGGQTSDGTTVGNFFNLSTTDPARSLTVAPKGAGELAVGSAGRGELDGSLADKISQLGTGPGAPDNTWANIVTGLGVQSRGAQQHEALSSAAEISAQGSRASQASVSLDEENVNLLTNQHAYQAAARVMTAVDEALDVLINRTGLVGR